jgi:putative membrane protein
MNKDLILREKLALQRTVLANQSTFLAFLRTAMYFLVAGISINNLTSFQYGKLTEIVFIIVSLTLLTIGIINYKRQKIKIKASEKHIGEYKDEYETTKA